MQRWKYDVSPYKCQMDAKGSMDAATVDADEDSVPEKNNFSPRRKKLCIRDTNTTS